MKVKLNNYWYGVLAIGFLILVIKIGVDMASVNGEDKVIDQGKKVSNALKSGFNEIAIQYIDKQIFITENDIKGITSYSDQSEKAK